MLALEASILAERLSRHRVTEGRDENVGAAVAAIVRPRPAADVELLFIRRADRVGDPWSGQMAFPGGRRDASDPTILDTAVREVKEEVGLDLGAHGRLLGRLPDVPAIARGRHTGLTIAPFVFMLEGPGDIRANEEVAEALWTPVGPLVRGEGAGIYPYEHEGTTLELPCMRLGERVVWGLTYRMLSQLIEAVSA